jgi:hypothetical protein
MVFIAEPSSDNLTIKFPEDFHEEQFYKREPLAEPSYFLHYISRKTVMCAPSELRRSAKSS